MVRSSDGCSERLAVTSRTLTVLAGMILVILAYLSSCDIGLVWEAIRADVTSDTVVWETSGPCSTFGGPWDSQDAGNKIRDVSHEGLALWSPADAETLVDLGVLIEHSPASVGLARRLDPDAWYVACRWPGWEPESRPQSRRRVRECRARVTGRFGTVWATPVDWGPHALTGRAVDMSPGLASAIGARTGDSVRLRLIR